MLVLNLTVQSNRKKRGRRYEIKSTNQQIICVLGRSVGGWQVVGGSLVGKSSLVECRHVKSFSWLQGRLDSLLWCQKNVLLRWTGAQWAAHISAGGQQRSTAPAKKHNTNFWTLYFPFFYFSPGSPKRARSLKPPMLPMMSSNPWVYTPGGDLGNIKVRLHTEGAERCLPASVA